MVTSRFRRTTVCTGSATSKAKEWSPETYHGQGKHKRVKVRLQLGDGCVMNESLNEEIDSAAS